MIVDTGSTGTRIFASQIPKTVASLPPVTTSGSPVAECLAFVTSYIWGPVRYADIYIGGEKASKIPIQVIDDTGLINNDAGGSNAGVAPDCVKGNSGSTLTNSVSAFSNSNGIIGIAPLIYDCDSKICPAYRASSSETFNPMYFSCTSASGNTAPTCNTPVSLSLSLQVPNVVSQFPVDNNGTIITLPNVSTSTGAADATGKIIFGINTQSNNQLDSSYTVVPLDSYGTFMASITVGNTVSAFNGSFLDSGTSTYNFNPPPGLNVNACSVDSGYFGYLCPSSLTTIPVNLRGSNSTTGGYSTNIYIQNAQTLFDANNGTNIAFSSIGSSGQAGSVNAAFDFGLSFFFGRSIVTSIPGLPMTNAPSGVTSGSAFNAIK